MDKAFNNPSDQLSSFPILINSKEEFKIDLLLVTKYLSYGQLGQNLS
jgi:hypothetical protein